MKRTDNPALARRLLDECLYATLAMTLPEGGAYCVPVSPAREGDTLYFHCGRKGHKLDAMRANPRVCVTVVGEAAVVPGKFTIEYESVVAFGSAHEVTDPAELDHALRLICVKLCPEDMPDYPNALERWLPATAVWRVDLEALTTKGPR